MTQPRKVLLAYDGSNGAKQALEDLKRNRAGLPKEGEIIVLCVADVWTTARVASFGPYGLGAAPVTAAQLQTIEEAEHAALKDARRVALKASQELHANRPGWEVRAESCADAPAWGIVKRAEEWKADLIVMGSHGRSALGRIVLGSVSQTVVREAPCAIRVVRGRMAKRDAPAHLIIGVDGSPDAEAAVQVVAERVWPVGSAVRLVTAIGDPLSTAIPSLRWIAAHDGQQATWMRRMIEDPAERLRTAGLSVSSVVRRGDPRKVLVEEARRWDADSLFVGARGFRGIKRFLLGSVSTAVAMRAPCPVEVVRPTPRRASQGPVRQQTHVQGSFVRAR
jgi:nucleotide-binding universal stress UspA family protein